MDREEIRIFTARSVAAGVAVGAGAAFALHDLAGASAELAALAGLPAGVVAAVLPVTWRDGRFDWLMQSSSASRRYPGFLVSLLVSLLIVAPSALVDRAFADGALGTGDERALELLFFLTGLATFVLGGVTATLERLEKDDGADPRWAPRDPPAADRRR